MDFLQDMEKEIISRAHTCVSATHLSLVSTYIERNVSPSVCQLITQETLILFSYSHLPHVGIIRSDFSVCLVQIDTLVPKVISKPLS